MPQSRSRYEFFQDASLSQKLAHKMPEYKEYAGADSETSLQLAFLNVLNKFGMINLSDPEWAFIKALLDEKRKALFATSEKVNEISKMGMQMPKAEDIWEKPDDDEDENP